MIVDLAILPQLLAYTWRLGGNDYPATPILERYLYLHRFIASLVPISGAIMLTRPKLLVHHINGNKYDDRIENLQLVTRRQHVEIHRSRGPRPGRTYKGVQYVPLINSKRPYIAYVRVEGKRHHAGYHATEEEAARAVDAMIKTLKLPNAYLNFGRENEKDN